MCGKQGFRGVRWCGGNPEYARFNASLTKEQRKFYRTAERVKDPHQFNGGSNELQAFLQHRRETEGY